MGQFLLMQNYFNFRKQCPACESTDLIDLYQNPFDEDPVKSYLMEFYSKQGKVEFEYLKDALYHIVKCNNCELIYQKEIANDELMERLYEHWIDPKIAKHKQEKFHDLTRYAYYAQEIMQIISHFEKQPADMNVFDFGMGWGEWAMMAKGFGCKTHGSELSQERIDHAEKNGIKVILWESIPEYEFDFINTEQVFEHLPDPLETLKYLKTALKPNGIIKISVPNAVNIDQRITKMDWNAVKGTKYSLNPVSPLEHINCYQVKSITTMAQCANLKQISPRMSTQYKYTTDWSTPKKIIKNILLPLYRKFLNKQNYIYLQNCN